MAFCGLVALLAAASEAAALDSVPVVLNEVLYDPEGADSGREFVELINCGTQTVVLQGYRLQFANGATGPPWQTRWTGGAEDQLTAGAYFLIVDSGYSGEGTPQAEVNLSLQNGPDAIRLLRADGSSDVLGYGELIYPEMFEGRPHPDIATGHSLGRRPDGFDRDDNEADWQELPTPSPGAPNFESHAAVIDAWRAEPPSLPTDGQTVDLFVQLRNSGLEVLPGGEVHLLCDGLAAQSWLEPLPPAEARGIQFHWRPTRHGRHDLQLRLAAGGQAAPLQMDLGAYQVGPAELYLNEVMAAPETGACEWVEIGNSGESSVDLAGYVLRDEDGPWRPLPAGLLAPRQWLVLVQTRTSFISWWEQLLAAGARPACGLSAIDAAVIELPGSWPSLNNTAPAGRAHADRLYLALLGGAVVDHVTIGSAGFPVPAGRSLARVTLVPRGDPARNWVASTSVLGATPACANSVTPADAPDGSFILHPNPFGSAVHSEQSVLHILFTIASSEQAWDALVFDLWGRQVRDLGGDRLGPGQRDVLWDGSGDDGTQTGPGAYIVLLRTYAADGRVQQGRKKLVVFQGAASR